MIIPWGIERILQMIQRYGRVTLHKSTHPRREQDQTEKSTYGLDWLQKSIWYALTKLYSKLPQYIQNIRWSQKLYLESHENLERGIDGRRKKLSWSDGPMRFISKRCAITVTIHNCDDEPLNHILRKCTAGCKLSKLQEQINHLIYMDDIKLFAKNEKELETLMHAVRIYSQDRRTEFSIDKCAKLVMKSGKRLLTEGMERTNRQD